MSQSSIDSIFRLIDRPVWIVTAQHGDRRGGLAATWLMQASINPELPVVVAGIAPNHFTSELIDGSRAFAAHLLRVDQSELVWPFAIGSGRDRDKLAGLKASSGATGSPLLADSLAWLDCRVVARYSTGDRIYFWADVVAGGHTDDSAPLTERQLLDSANPEQKALLRAGLLADIEVQRPLRLRRS